MNNGEQFFNTSGAGGYAIERSLRFNGPDSAYLSRTPASASNRKTWTWAGWIKLAANTGGGYIWRVEGGSYGTGLYYGGGSTVNQYLQFELGDGVSDSGYLRTTAWYRDFSAWYHVVVYADTDNLSATDRAVIYVNGVRQVVTDTGISLGLVTTMNDGTTPFQIGAGYGLYTNGYLADVHFIDGQALDPTSFGEFDANGIWQPKAYSGSYGTNGCLLYTSPSPRD